MKKSDQKKFVPILEANRKEIMANAKRAVKGEIHLDANDFPDEIDTASSESGLAFIGRLRERERALLSKIERALQKIEDGSYGTCAQCSEDIGMARLQARAVADLCIDCKSEQERLER